LLEYARQALLLIRRSADWGSGTDNLGILPTGRPAAQLEL